MTVDEYIRDNREKIDRILVNRLTESDIPGVTRTFRPFTDEQRRQFILRDEYMSLLARQAGVVIPP